MPPYGPPRSGGDGRNMLRPYGLADTYPSQEGIWAFAKYTLPLPIRRASLV